MIDEDARKGLESLREEVPANLVGKLPKVTCPECRKKENRGECSSHRKRKCEECGGWLTPAHTHLDYVGHAETTSKLLEVDPTWNWEPLAFSPDGLPAFDADGGLWIKLTVCGVTRLGYGTADNANGFKARGDIRKEIIGDALRNAAMRFGWALNLWAKTDIHERTPQENDEPQAQVAEAVERKAKRERRTKPPERDEFATPQEPKAQDGPPDSMLRNMAIGLKDRGFATDDERHAEVSRIVGRPITSTKQLSAAEARHVMRSLAGTPEHPNPNPRNGDTGKPLDPALFVPSLQMLLTDARGESGPSVAASLNGLIGNATARSALEAIWKVADEAHKGGHITRDEFANLNLLGQAKDRELSIVAEAHEAAPSAEQLAKHDHFTQLTEAATTPEELGGIWSAIVDSRAADQLTPVQVGVLEKLLDDRYESLRKPQQQSGQGWSHRRMDQMAGSGAAQ